MTPELTATLVTAIVGCLGAVSIASDKPNTLYHSKYLIVRVEIGMRKTMEEIKSSIV